MYWRRLMSSRKFELPNEKKLNKEQERILGLPEKGQYLIVGGPGTGKSSIIKS